MASKASRPVALASVLCISLLTFGAAPALAEHPVPMPEENPLPREPPVQGPSDPLPAYPLEDETEEQCQASPDGTECLVVEVLQAYYGLTGSFIEGAWPLTYNVAWNLVDSTPALLNNTVHNAQQGAEEDARWAQEHVPWFFVDLLERFPDCVEDGLNCGPLLPPPPPYPFGG